MEVPAIAPGTRVRVRRRTWVVTAVDAGERCRLLTLAGSGGGTASELTVIQPFDDVEPVTEAGHLQQVGIRTWRRACRAAILSDRSPESLVTAANARIELLAYQLEPALALLNGCGTRLLIADEVGLGKTVQAALAIAELRARGAGNRVLILCPAGLREQWASECRQRFNIELSLFDQAGMRRYRARLPIGTNPWTTESGVVSSIDFVKRADVLPAVLAAPWDVVVIDEAHGVANTSDRHDAAVAICREAPYVLLLTATPHSGHDESFASLCALGSHSPQPECGSHPDALVVFRRSRLEAGRDAGRRVHVLRVRLSAPERAMHQALNALTTAVRRERSEINRNVCLLLSLLHKRALSSAFALAASAQRRLVLLDCPGSALDEQLLLPFDMAGEVDDMDVAPMWAEPALQDRRTERRLMQQLVETATRAAACESKFHRLRRILACVREPAIVFTEYRDTLAHVRETIVPHAAIIHGGMSRDQRRAALELFPRAGVLLATDAAGEGLNLQQHCRVVINLELPWNPMRLEQRIGRVDRIGQSRRVHAFHLLADGSGETSLLERLSSRVTRAQDRVGAADPLRGRPEWTEEQSIDLVVFGRVAGSEPDDKRGDSDRVTLSRLVEAADREHQRLVVIRRVAAAAHRADDAAADAGHRPIIARTHRRRVRSWLAGATLAVFRTTVTDTDGCRVACRFDSVIVHHSAARIDHAPVPALERQLTHLATVIAGLVQRRDWIAATRDVHGRFVSARVSRARQLAYPQAAAGSPIQVGLFDRRAEHAEAARSEVRRDLASAAHERLTRAERSADLCVSEPKLMLVLTAGPLRL